MMTAPHPSAADDDFAGAVGWAAHDRSEQLRQYRLLHAAHRRLSIQTRASELLEQSLDLHATVPLLGELLLEEVADAVAVDVIGAEGRNERVIDIGTQGLRTPVAYPLLDGARLLGTMTVVPRATGDEDSELLGQLSRRLARAIANSQRYAERDHVARTLQNSLLPPSLPQVGGFDLAAAFGPAGAGNEVGGDFYDAFSLGGEEWALVLGDVCGKGADAAAVTALARYSVRTITAREQRPRRVLDELNDSLLRHGERERFCTVLFARVREDDGRVTLSSGGHPPPILVSPGCPPEAVAISGTLLGVTDRPRLAETQLCLTAGQTLVLYTDGVLEALTRGGALLGMEGLMEVLARMAHAPAQEIADTLVGLAQGAPGGQRDDAAALVLRAH